MNNFKNEIRTLQLEENNFNTGTLYRLKKDWTLKLQISSKLIAENVRVFCNLPPVGTNNQTALFKRSTYYEYKWTQVPGSSIHDDFCRYISIECKLAGAYDYYFTFNNETSKENSKGGANFLVDPEIKLNSGQSIELDSLQIQTYLSKLLGPLDEWKPRLEVAKQSGYNMIHFTPVSELSKESDSAYCIRNHMELIKTANIDSKYSIEDLSDTINFMYKEYDMLSICDLVYNHMANDSEFLQLCPEASYNMNNSTHLRPAFVLDRVFSHATIDIANGVYESRGIARDRVDYSNIDALRHILRWEEIPKYNFPEFFMIDLEQVMLQVGNIGFAELQLIKKDPTILQGKIRNENAWHKLNIVQDEAYNRLGSSVDCELVKQIFRHEFRSFDLTLDSAYSKENNPIMNEICVRIADILKHKNYEMKSKIEGYLDEAVDNVIANFKYHFFADDGPKWDKVNASQPIVTEYFYFPFENKDVKSDELLAFDHIEGAKIQAHNGWVMTDDPLQNFAAKGSLTYFRRHLISWGDSVKLRYGNSPEDNPKLWEFMADYTRMTARIFHGVRLDNCHSTPIHVAQYFLDQARAIRPNLFVIAELFTNNEKTDNKFVAELGITSLIRESLNAWNSQELGRLVHRFGGDPVGSFFQQTTPPLVSGTANASFFDITHDNESLIKKRCVFDALPSSSLVLMSGCAVGSTRGFDEFVPHHIHVVNEKRPYSFWCTKYSDSKVATNCVNFDTGIIKAKSILNKLHYEMSLKGFSQIYVDQFDADTICVTRHNPQSHESFIMLARTSFVYQNNSSSVLHKPLDIPSKVDQILIEAHTVFVPDKNEYVRNESFVNGIENYKVFLSENVELHTSSFIDRIDYDDNASTVHFKYFPPGAVVVFKVVMNEKSLKSLPIIRESVFELSNSFVGGKKGNSEIEKTIGSLTFDELNILLFRCSTEESGEQIDSNTYDIPNHGPLVYCGLQGFVNILETERLKNNIGHPMFENLRQGDWMMNYISDRLKKYAALKPVERKRLKDLSCWLEKVFGAVSQLPRYLIPSYFDLIVTELYNKVLERCFTLMTGSNQNDSFSIINGSHFLKSLTLGSVLFNGHLKSALLPDTVLDSNLTLSLSAGLPHFADSYMRNWGRDTFISIRGLLLLTNRFQDARNLILSYGSTLRHGLIPNLLGEGKMARFNCRDAVWWWLNSIKEYTKFAPNGFEILDCEILRMYPSDEMDHPSDEQMVKKNGTIVKLRDLIQEAMEVHVNGLSFRERNAGLQIDEHMLHEGFNNQIGVDLETGFVFGGNKLNCGTWMDKLGSSVDAGNKGIPATPRDGSAVELVGLSRSVLDWLIDACSKSKYQYDGVIVNKENNLKYTWVDWAKRIDDNFEKHFWISESLEGSEHINKRNIYKDTLNSSVPWTDYQFRPNFLISLTVAPQMFNKENAKKALEMCRNHLVNEPNSVGVKTLDASDYNYCGVYDNSNRSSDMKLAHGFNYHQGPEWLWPTGYFLRSHLIYYSDHTTERDQALRLVKNHLGKLHDRLYSSDWKSLPELTNQNGEECYFSCAAQAWSVATTLEVFYDLAHLN